MNPLVPSAFDVAFAVIVVSHLVLASIAFVLLVRAREARFISSLLVILLIPVVGSVAWLVTRPRAGRPMSPSIRG